jgi:hypothetical protein
MALLHKWHFKSSHYGVSYSLYERWVHFPYETIVQAYRVILRVLFMICYLAMKILTFVNMFMK